MPLRYWLAAIITIALIVGMFIGIMAASAQTRAEVNACWGDGVRLCGVDPHRRAPPSWAEKLRIGACMVFHRDQLSPRCRAVLKAHGF